MKKFFQHSLALVILVGSSFVVCASHFMGGQITYKCLGGNNYEITLKIYRDCNSACNPFGNGCSGINLGPGGSLGAEIYADPPLPGQPNPIFMAFIDTNDVTPTCTPTQLTACEGGGPYGIQEFIFQAVVNVPPGGGPYTFSNNDAARNVAITTIDNCGNPYGCQRWYIYALLNPNLGCNNSPNFLNLPTAYVCLNQPYIYNNNSYDADGDSLVYVLVPCMQYAFTTVDYFFPWSGTNPLGSSTPINVDPLTGEITFTPNVTNQVAVLSIRVEEYRNGTKIGEVIRDLQMTVIDCDNNVPEVRPITNTGGTDTTIYAGIPFCIPFKATDADFSDNTKNLISLSVTSGILPPATWSNPSPANIVNQGNFCWTPKCTDARSQPYLVTVLAQDNACPIPGLSVATFNIYVKLPNPSPPNLYCVSDINNDTQLELDFGYPLDTTQLDKYMVYRSTNSLGPYSLIDSLSNDQLLQFIDASPGLNPKDSIYYYYLTGMSSTCRIESAPFDSIANIRLKSTFSNPNLTLKWNPPTTTVYTPQYRVMRKNGSFWQLVTITDTTYFLDSLTSCTPMFLQHRIDVIHPSGLCTSYSNTVYDTVPGVPLPSTPAICKSEVNLDNSVTIYFNADTTAVDSFNVYRYNTTMAQFDYIGSSTDLITKTYTDNTIDASKKSYEYEIDVLDTCNNLSLLSEVHRTINAEATAQYLSNNILWNSYKDWTPDYYVIYRGISLPLDSIGTTTDTNYTDSPLSCNQRYIYRIKAVRNAGVALCDFVWGDTTSAKPYDNISPGATSLCAVSVAANFTDVEVNYDNSMSADVNAYEIYRKSPNMLLSIEPGTGGASSINTYTHAGVITPMNQRSCYAVISRDSCGNISAPTTTHCTIDLTATGDDNKNNLQWLQYVGWNPDYYVIYRGTSFPLDSIGTSTDTTFIDSSIVKLCNVTYFYQIKAVNSSNPPACNYSFSDTSSAKPFDNIAPANPNLCVMTVQSNINDVSITFNNSSSPDVETYALYESGNATPLAIFPPGAQPFIHTNVISPANQYKCYHIVAVDTCGNSSVITLDFCTIDVSADGGDLKNIVTWTPFTLWAPGYYVVYAGKNLPLDSIGTSASTSFSHQGISCNDNFLYQIKAVRSGTSCTESWSDTARAQCYDISSIIKLPNVFSPNGDGINDLFKPMEAENIRSMDFKVYDRWGVEVFQTNNNLIEWDGRNKYGVKCAGGVYYYVARVGILTHNKEEALTMQNWVTLIREN